MVTGAEGARIEQLLDELRATAGPTTWPRVEELLRRMVGWYGGGLARLFEVAGDGLDEAARERLGRDELVSSLLLLHGLHPHAPDARIRAALDELSSRVGARVALVELRDGAAHLRIDGGCGATAQSIAEAARRAVEDAAPEVTSVALDGGAPSPARDLVQIDLARSRVPR
jgi:hypothetical protein